MGSFVNLQKIAIFLSCICALILLAIKLSYAERIVIRELPFAINEPGHYYLESNLSAPQGENTNALIVNVDNVTIDFEGHSIIGNFDREKHSVGVYGFNRSNIKLFNGKIIGFTFGMKLESDEDTKNIHIKNMLFDRNQFRGIKVDAENVTVEDSIFWETGGTYFFSDSFSAGVEIKGANCVVRDNSIKQTFPVGIGESIGLIIYKGQGCLIENNTIQNNINFSLASERRDSDLFVSYGFWVGTADYGLTFVSNKIEGFTYYGNFNLLKGEKKLSNTFTNNQFLSSACALWEGVAVETLLLEKNFISKEDNQLCVQDVDFLRARVKESDARSLFRFASAVYAKGATNLTFEEKCDYAKGVKSMIKAAELGFHEAIRIKHRIINAFENNLKNENLETKCY